MDSTRENFFNNRAATRRKWIVGTAVVAIPIIIALALGAPQAMYKSVTEPDVVAAK